MVDQALALRPEERRPLFEEVAGVRRHERRRRRAEEQLTESEANLARVEDILAELRPQARRLAAQAEQQATRESTAVELVEALMISMHARWHEAAGRLAVAGARPHSAPLRPWIARWPTWRPPRPQPRHGPPSWSPAPTWNGNAGMPTTPPGPRRPPPSSATPG